MLEIGLLEIRLVGNVVRAAKFSNDYFDVLS